ncbi:MAG: flavodoxin family protein [Gallicola sp.]|nr:flavodoxin family protein [Gallicola sp.]
MKNVLIFIGSNSNHSFTEEILNEIASELDLLAKGKLNIKIINIRDINILNCEGCVYCFTTGNCKLDKLDELSKVKEMFLKSDTIIFAAPVYANYIPGITKNFLDRLAYWIHILRLAGKKGIIITTSSRKNIGQANTYLQMFFTGMGVCVQRAINIINRKQNRVKYLSEVIFDDITNHTYSNSMLENHFLRQKEFYQQVYENNDKQNEGFELNYWEKSGMLDANSIEEWLMGLLNER